MVNLFKGNTTMVGRNGKSNSSNIEYGGRGMTLEKDIELLMIII